MEWKKSWKSSEKPEKQRKHRRNAPNHHQKKFLSARLDDDVREKVGTKTLPVREGDQAEVMRGDHRGETGQVTAVDQNEYKIYLDGIERERVDTTSAKVAIRPSNLKLTKLNTDDHRRLQKYDVSEEEKEDISAEDETEEETESSEEDIEGELEEDYEDIKEEGDSEESAGEDEGDVDYDGVADQKVGEIKEKVEEIGLDPEKVLETEKDNKDRKTLKEWLNKRIEGGEN